MSRNRSILNRELILKTALDILDSLGLEALSMRTIANQLNVKAMSLYNHIKNKEDLLNGVVEIILSEVQYSENTADWKTNLRSIACSFHAVLIRHPNAISIIATHSPVTDNGMKNVENMLWILKEANIKGVSIFSLIHILLAYVIGHASMSVVDSQSMNHCDIPSSMIDLAAWPNHADVAQDYFKRDISREFIYGLDLLLHNL